MDKVVKNKIVYEVSAKTTEFMQTMSSLGDIIDKLNIKDSIKKQLRAGFLSASKAGNNTIELFNGDATSKQVTAALEEVTKKYKTFKDFIRNNPIEIDIDYDKDWKKANADLEKRIKEAKTKAAGANKFNSQVAFDNFLNANNFGFIKNVTPNRETIAKKLNEKDSTSRQAYLDDLIKRVDAQIGKKNSAVIESDKTIKDVNYKLTNNRKFTNGKGKVLNINELIDKQKSQADKYLQKDYEDYTKLKKDRASLKISKKDEKYLYQTDKEGNKKQYAISTIQNKRRAARKDNDEEAFKAYDKFLKINNLDKQLNSAKYEPFREGKVKREDLISNEEIITQKDIENYKELQKLKNSALDQKKANQDTTVERQNIEAFQDLKTALVNTEKEVQRYDNEVKDLEKTQTELKQNTETEAKVPLEEFERVVTELNTQLEGMQASGKQASNGLSKLEGSTKSISQAFSRLTYVFDISNIIMYARRAIMGALSDFREVDKTFNEISVVTGKSMDEMWAGFGEVNKIAQQYGVTAKDVVDVQNLYYHQGKSTAQVTKLTAEALKLAKISGMEFADASDKMTAALNAYKLSAQEAGQVTDTVSALASNAAADSKEIMNALSRTASISANVGTSLQNTTVLLTKMIETTREPAENLGTALKTVSARFGELKGQTKDFGDDVDLGEDVDVNKIETALRSAGVALTDTSGQFRNFDDVIFELSKRWESLDKNTQRYIATQAAGSRQQSRFIAMVEDYDRLVELQAVAEDSAGLSTVQLQRSMESLETATNRVKTAWQELYTKFLSSELFKGILSDATSLIKGLVSLSDSLPGKLGPAVTITTVIIGGIMAKSLLSTLETKITEGLPVIINKAKSKAQQTLGKFVPPAPGATTGFEDSGTEAYEYGASVKDENNTELNPTAKGYKINEKNKDRQSKILTSKADSKVRTDYAKNLKKDNDKIAANQNQTQKNLDKANKKIEKSYASVQKSIIKGNADVVVSNDGMVEKVVPSTELMNTANKSLTSTVTNMAGSIMGGVASGMAFGAMLGNLIGVSEEGQQVLSTVGAVMGGLIPTINMISEITSIVTARKQAEAIAHLFNAEAEASENAQREKGIISSTVAAVKSRILTKTKNTEAGVTTKLTVAEILLNAIREHGVIAGLAVAAAAVAVTAAIIASTDAETEATVTAEEYNEANTKVKDGLTSLTNFTTKYKKALQYKKNEEILTAEQSQEYQKILQELNDEYPELVDNIDGTTLSLNDNRDLYDSIVEAKKKDIDANRELTNSYKGLADGVYEAGTKAARAQDAFKNAMSNLSDSKIDDIADEMTGYNESGRRIGDIFESTNREALESLRDKGFSREFMEKLEGESDAREDWNLLDKTIADKNNTQLQQIKKDLNDAMADNKTNEVYKTIKDLYIESGTSEFRAGQYAGALTEAFKNTKVNPLESILSTKDDNYIATQAKNSATYYCKQFAATVDEFDQRSISKPLIDALSNSEEIKNKLVKGDKQGADELMSQYSEQFYKTFSKSEQQSLDDLLNSYGSKNADELDKAQKQLENILKTQGLDINSGLGKALNERSNSLSGARKTAIEELGKVWNGELGGSFSKGFTDYLTTESAKNLKDLTTKIINQFGADEAGQAAGKLAGESFVKQYEATVSNLTSTQRKVVDSTDFTDLDSISKASVEFVKAGGNLNDFKDIAYSAGDLYLKSAMKYEDAIEKFKKIATNAKNLVGYLKNAVEGTLSYEDVFELIKMVPTAQTEDFTVSSKGFGLSEEKAIEFKKIGLNLQKLQIELEQIMLADKLSEIESLTKINVEEFERLKLKKASGEMTAEEAKLFEEYIQQYKGLTDEQQVALEKYSDTKQQLTAIDLLMGSIDALMSDTVEDLEKALDKAIKLKDALKSYLDSLKEINGFSNIDRIVEDLENQSAEIEIDMELSANSDKIYHSIIDSTVNITKKLQAAEAKVGASTSQMAEISRIVRENYSALGSVDKDNNFIENYTGLRNLKQQIYELDKKIAQASTDEQAKGYELQKEKLEQILDNFEYYKEQFSNLKKIQAESNQQYKEAIKAQKELLNTMYNNIKTVEDKMIELFQNRDDKILESTQNKYDAIKKADEDYLDQVQKNVQKERDIRTRQNTYESLAKSENKLALLMMDTSGKNIAQIAQLQDELKNQRQQVADEETDRAIQQMEEEFNKRAELMDKDLEYQQNYLEWKKTNMYLYNLEVQRGMAQNSEQIINEMKLLDDEWITGTSVAQKQWEENWEMNVANAKAASKAMANESLRHIEQAIEDIADANNNEFAPSIRNYCNVATTEGSKMNVSLDYTRKYYQAIIDKTDGISNLQGVMQSLANSTTNAANAANELADAQKRVDSTKGQKQATTLVDQKAGHRPVGTTLIKYVRDKQLSNSPHRYAIEFAEVRALASGEQIGLGGKEPNAYIVTYDNYAFPTSSFVRDEKKKAWIPKDFYSGIGFKFAKGGMVDYTGPAWVDGTKSNPEAFLSAADTRNIAALTDALSLVVPKVGNIGNSYAQNNSDTYINITIDVDSIDNDYSVDDMVNRLEEKILDATNGQVTFARSR